MYALVTLWQLPEAQIEELRPRLEQQVVPVIRQAPGFLEGYWTYERANGKSVGFTILQSAEHARDLRQAIESQIDAQNDPNVQLEMIRVQEIVAHAQH